MRKQNGPGSIDLPIDRSTASPGDRLVRQTTFLQRCTESGIGRGGFPHVRHAVEEVDALLFRGGFDDRAPEIRRARALLSEYYEYFGEPDRARGAIVVYEPIYGEGASESAEREPRLCVWYANALYRSRNLNLARRRIEEAEAGYIRRNDPFGLGFARFYRARIEHRGAGSRRARELALQAIADFREALGARAGFRVGICHVLLAWIAYWDENWPEAEQHLSQAEIHLEGPSADDPIHLGRVAFIRGCLRRASARTADEFDSVLEQFARAINDFKDATHGPFLAAAYNNRALTYTQRWHKGDSDLALNDFDKALEAPGVDDRARVENRYFRARWHLRADDVIAADDLAAQAVGEASSLGTLQAEVRVLRARTLLRIRDDKTGVAPLRVASAKGKPRGARSSNRKPHEDQVKALRLATIDEMVDGELKLARTLVLGRRRRTEVACWLVQSEHEYRLFPQDLSLARTSLLKARQRMEGLSHLFLARWADDVESRIAWLDGGLYWTLNSPLDYRAAHERMKVWLVRAAIDRVGDGTTGTARRSDVVSQLGIPRQILERWLNKWQAAEDSAATNDIRHIIRALYSRKRGSKGR